MKQGKPAKLAGCSCFDSSFLDRRLVTGCVVSAVISVVTAFVITKVGFNSQDKSIQEIAENCESIDNKIRATVDSISSLNVVIESLKEELKSGKNDLTYIYVTLSALQRDISAIKQKFPIETVPDDVMQKLSSENASFIESLENLVKDGVPFDGFIESCSSKIDIEKYISSGRLLGFAKQNTKSVDSLHKDFIAVGEKVFEVKFTESFWERQKRFIKEKITEAIKIRKTDDDGETSDEMDDKTLFELASKHLSDGKTNEALITLEKIKMSEENLQALVSDLRKRVELENAFFEFKKEFVEAGTRPAKPEGELEK
jgi:archaellum component FlaC